MGLYRRMLGGKIAEYYKLNGNALGSLGANLTETSITYSTGKIGSAAVLNGTSSYLSTSGKLNNSSSGSISAWFNVSVFQTAMRIFGYGGVGANAIFSLETRDIGGGVWRLAFTYRDDAGANLAIFRGSTTLSTSTWYHAIWSGNGSSYTLYLNGVAETLTSISGSNHGKWINTVTATSGQTTVGALTNNSTIMNLWRGSLDEVGIWSSPLDSTEISQLYNGGNGLSYPFGTGMFQFFLQ